MIFDRNHIAPTGRFLLTVYQNGQVIERMDEPNLVVNSSKTMMAHLLAGGATDTWSINYIGFGTNGDPTQLVNTSLTEPFVKAITTRTVVDASHIRFNFTLDAAEAINKPIREFGLLSGDKKVLFARKIRQTALNKTSSIALSGSWIINF